MKAKEDTLSKPYIVEYYYKTQWGHADEFVGLYKKNHEPILKKQMEMGRILKLSLVRPRLHGTEDGRWDFRVTIVWKNILMTDDGFDEHKLAVEMFPDQEAFRKEEQRRFEILAGHWDLPVVEMESEE